jgi:hypothetical protein
MLGVPHLSVQDGAGPGLYLVATAGAEEAWLVEMSDLCSRTQDAMSMTIGELRAIVQRCDKLKLSIESLDESTRKVYGKRLKMCRDLYAFVLDDKEKREAH